MFNSHINDLITEIKQANPIFTGGYFFDPDNENGFRGFTDEINNYFYIELNQDEDGNKYFLADGPYGGCKSYTVTLSLNIYFILNKCKDKSLAIEKLLNTINFPYSVTLISDDADLIYREATGSEEGFKSNKTLIRFTVSGSLPWTFNDCEDGLCDNDCC